VKSTSALLGFAWYCFVSLAMTTRNDNSQYQLTISARNVIEKNTVLPAD